MAKENIFQLNNQEDTEKRNLFKNYFETNNPLNLLNPMFLNIPDMSQKSWEETYEELKRLLEEELKQQLEQTSQEKSVIEPEEEDVQDTSLSTLDDLLSDYQEEPSNSLQQNSSNVLSSIYSLDYLNTLNPVNNTPVTQSEETSEYLLNYSKNLESFQKIQDDVYNFGKVYLSEAEDKDADNLKLLAKKALIKDGFATEENFEDKWNATSDDMKQTLMLQAIGENYFTGEALQEFYGYDDALRFDMLASALKNNPLYTSLTSKAKKDIDWSNNPISEAFNLDLDRYTNRFLGGLAGTSSGVDRFVDIVGGGGIVAVGNLGKFAGSVLEGAGEFIHSRIKGVGLDEKLDNLISAKDDEYVTAKAGDLYATMLTKINKEKSKNDSSEIEENLLKDFDHISKKASGDYTINKGTSLTELTDNEKLQELAKYITRSKMYGEEAAELGVADFWNDLIAGKQVWYDKTLRTAGQFASNGAADVISFAAVVTTLPFMAVDPHGSYNPEDWTVDGEGFADALVKRNPLLDYAHNLQETGCWTLSELERYKELGVNALKIYKTREEENAWISGNDFYDLVGQYGFSAATTLLSLGGSGAVKGAVSATSKAVTRGTKWGKFIKNVTTAGRTRKLLKAGLAKGATRDELTAAKEVIAHMTSKNMYRGNLLMEGALGTAEGALEAEATYETMLLDNDPNKVFARQEAAINDDLAVIAYMNTHEGFTPILRLPDEYGNMLNTYSQSLMDLARGMMRKELEDAKEAFRVRVENDAADAAAANFLSNSLINGYLNVFMKEAIMSRDMREASRKVLKRNKMFQDVVDIKKKGEKWVADFKNANTNTKAKKIWNFTKGYSAKALKNAGGEALEEYTQNISDVASRLAFEADLQQYMATVFDKDAREAFQTDWNNIVNTGLNSINTELTSKENVKAGIFGGLSSLIGGPNLLGITLVYNGFKKGRSEEDKGFLGTAKWASKTLLNLHAGGLQQAYRDYTEELESAQRLIDSTNAWLSNEKNQALLTHMGGAAGFKKAMEESIIAGDLFSAHNNKLGLSIENALMLLTVKDTEYGQAVLRKMSIAETLLGIALNQDNIFDLNGNYIGDSSTVGPEMDKQIKDTISAYKNQLGDATRNTILTDREILQRVGLNALEFLQLQDEVKTAQLQIRSILGEEDLDPLTELAYVYALLSQKNARKRLVELRNRLQEAGKVNSEMSEEDRTALNQRSGLNTESIDFLIEHGSIKEAEKTLEELQKERNSLIEKLNNKKTTSEEKQDIRIKQRYLNQEISRISNQISTEKFNLAENAEKSLEDSEEKSITLLPKTELFSVGDMAAMSPSKVAEIIANKKKYSAEQLAVIDKFLNIVRSNLARLESDGTFALLSNAELEKEYSDLTALENKVNAYDRYLDNYIRNPEFLNSVAASYREKERVRTLRLLYKEDLLLREGESVLDFRERLGKKIDFLQKLHKNEDAQILQKLISENKEVAKVSDILGLVMIANVLYGNLKGSKEVKSEDYKLMDKTLVTLVAESGKSLKEIRELLQTGNIAEVVKYLTKKTADGQYVLNKELAKDGLKTFDLQEDSYHNETELAAVLQKMKSVLDFYLNLREDKSKAATSQTLKDINLENPPASPVDRNPKVSNDPQPALAPPAGNESIILTIVTPGDIELKSSLGKFLKDMGVNMVVKNASVKNNAKVFFAVFKKAGSPIVFAVLALKRGEKASGKLISIEGKQYLILGVMDGKLSRTLSELGRTAYENLSNEEEGALLSNLDGIVSAELSLKDPTSISEQSQLDPIPLKDLLGNDEGAITSYAVSLVNAGKKETKEDIKNGVKIKKTFLEDDNGNPVALNDKSEASDDVGKFPLGDTTLEDILKACDLADTKSVQNAITLLKQNEFFKAFFDSWTDYDNINTLEDDTKYSRLIGDFIFFGYTYSKNSLGATSLNPRSIVEEGKRYILIDSTRPREDDKPITFKIELPTKGEAAGFSRLASFNAEVLALKALQLLVLSLEFWRAKPQLGMNIIKSKKISPAVKDKEKERIVGLIKAGLLVGYKPIAIKRNITVRNPFIKVTGSTKSNGPQASQMDPPQKGVVPGGKVSVEDGTPKEGDPQTVAEAVSESLNEELKKALKIVDRLIAKSKAITLKDSNDTFYTDEGDNTEHVRVTSLKGANIGGEEVEEFDASEDVANLSHAYGNTIDPILRSAIEILNKVRKEGRNLTTEDLMKEILKDEAFKENKEIPNWGSDILPFLKLVMDMHQTLTVKYGWTLVSKDIKVSGKVNVTSNGATVGKLPVAGTLDLLAYDREGHFIVIDIKTIHLADKDDKFYLQNNTPAWQGQVSPYQGVLQLENPDMIFAEHSNYIMPIFLSYSMPGLVPIKVAEDKMTVTLGSTPLDAPRFRTKKKVLKENESYSLEDFLWEIPNIPFKGYDYSRLSLELLEKIIPITPLDSEETKGNQETLPQEQPSSSEEEGEKPIITVEDALDKLDLFSKRTTKEARFTEFINNHVATTTRVKIGVVAKIASKVKEFLGKKDSSTLLKLELAKIFFNGDVTKLSLVLKNQEVSSKSLSKTLGILRDYYTSYIQKRNDYIGNINKRHHISKAVYGFLKGEISQDLLELELNKYQTSIGNVAELIEYMSSTNKEQTAESILKKLEESGIITEQYYQEELKNLNDTIESMQAKLDFINSPFAIRMLNERMSSIDRVVLDDSYEEIAVDYNGTIDRILKNKSGNYGVTKILRDIIHKSNNPQFKSLAATLLNQIKDKDLAIIVTIEDANTTFIEGSTKGKSITILKNSLDSYEHLERVVLHEALHAIIEVSPEVKESLQALLEETILRMLKVSGKTVDLIKNENYGLSSVDEFISEFFTNYAFLETLKTLDGNDYNNVFLKIVEKLKHIFFGDKSLYNQISKAMEVVINTTSIESIKRQNIQKSSKQTSDFYKLSAEALSMLISRGMTVEEFDTLTEIEKQQFKDCCA